MIFYDNIEIFKLFNNVGKYVMIKFSNGDKNFLRIKITFNSFGIDEANITGVKSSDRVN